MSTPLLVTVSEAVSIVGALGMTITPRQVRYLGVLPAQRTIAKNGGRLYDDVDVTVLATFAVLLARMRGWELPAWSARAALRYREGELRRAIQRRGPRFLVVDPIRGTASLSETADTGDTAIDVRALALFVSKAVRTCREMEPEVWTGAEREDLEELVT
jgi:hypothetical protein